MGLGNVAVIGGYSDYIRQKLLRAGFDTVTNFGSSISETSLRSYRLLVVARDTGVSIPQYIKNAVSRGELSIVTEWRGSYAVANAYGLNFSNFRDDSSPNGYGKTNISPIGHGLRNANFNLFSSNGDYEYFSRFVFTNLSQIIPIARSDYDSFTFVAEVLNVGLGRVILFGSDWQDSLSSGTVATLEDLIFKYAVTSSRPPEATDEKKSFDFTHSSSTKYQTIETVITPGGKKIIPGANTVKLWAAGDFDSTTETLEVIVDGTRIFGPQYLARLGSTSETKTSSNYLGEFSLPSSVIDKSSFPLVVNTATGVGSSRMWLEFSFTLVPTLVPMEEADIPFPQAIQKKENILKLRQQANTFRKNNGMDEIAWSDPNIVSGLTPIKAKHWNELEAGVKEVYDSRAVPIAVPEVQKQFDTPIKANNKVNNVNQLSNRIFNILRSFRNY